MFVFAICGFKYMCLMWVYVFVEIFASGVCNSLTTDYVPISAMPLPSQLYLHGYCCYLIEVRIGSMGLLRVMLLSTFPSLKI